MQQEISNSQVIELTNEITQNQGVCFDLDSISLHGTYADELSAYRAKKVWAATLQSQFLLDKEHDFAFSLNTDVQATCFLLRCEFTSACGRYAFWRLTNNQAPEAQYLIETGHVPNSESHYEELLKVPDLRPISEGNQLNTTFSDKRRQLFSRIFLSARHFLSKII